MIKIDVPPFYIHSMPLGDEVVDCASCGHGGACERGVHVVRHVSVSYTATVADTPNDRPERA